MRTPPGHAGRHHDADVASLKDAAAHLGVRVETLRKRLERGTLTGVKRDGRWFVSLDPHDTQDDKQDDTRDAERDSAPDSALREVIETLRSENAYLRSALERQLADHTEENRRKDHLIAGLIERVPAIAETVDAQSVPQDVNRAPVRDETRDRASASLQDAPWPPKAASDSMALRWRRWWRRVTGG